MKYSQEESSVLEFKREFPKNDQLIKTIIGFCNRFGGKIVIGVENDGTIIGMDEQEAENIMEYLDKSIYEATTPPILPLVYTRRIGESTLLYVEVSSGMNKPYYKRSEGMEKGTYIRLGRSTMRANLQMIEELKPYLYILLLGNLLKLAATMLERLRICPNYLHFPNLTGRKK